MTVQEIFASLTSSLEKHEYCFEKLANMGDFINYKAMKRMGEYYALWCDYSDRNLDRLLIGTYGLFPINTETNDMDIVPPAFYQNNKTKVDDTERAKFAAFVVDNTCEYLKEMLKVFEQAYCDLTEIKEIYTAICLKCFIEDLGCEIKYLMRHKLEFDNVKYMAHHMERVQDAIHDCYKEKTDSLKVGMK